ncbi:hypothetical protein [Streptomyces sp. NPDC002172]
MTSLSPSSVEIVVVISVYASGSKARESDAVALPDGRVAANAGAPPVVPTITLRASGAGQECVT